MRTHYERILYDTEQRVKKSFRIQVMKESDPFYGGFVDDHGIVQVKYSIYRIASMIAVYCNQDTGRYHDWSIYQRVMLGLSYVKRNQHENGLFDYVTCNFNSAPDTSFCLKKLIPAYQYLDRLSRTQEEEEIYKAIQHILLRGSHGLLEGGFHTPNHRWVIASMLLQCGVLFEDDTLMRAANIYLNEGIDCNEYGEYSEKSAGNYNRIVNDALMTIGECLKDDSYTEYVKRNLRMMLTYWELDGSIFTANSTRFDKDHIVFPKDYYMEYLKIGYKYHDTQLLSMCNRIFEIIQEQQLTSPDFLIHFMLQPELIDLEIQGSYQNKSFMKVYGDSGIVRGQQDGYTFTVMRNKSNFLYFHNGTIKMEMKIGGSFCEHRAFKADTLEEKDGKIHLHQTMKGWYYLPFKEAPKTSDWWKMDNASRDKKFGPDMNIDVWVTPKEKELEVRVKTSGVSLAPWRIELAFMGIELISNSHLALPVTGQEAFVLKDDMFEVSNHKDAIIIGPAFGTHHFIEGKEDSEAKTPGAATVYLTDYTEFDHTITICNKY